MAPTYFPLRWESTGEQWWFASPIDWAAANGHYDVVKQLLHLEPNLLIKLTSLSRIRRLETLWDDEEQHLGGVASCRCHVAKMLLQDSETSKGHNSLIRASYGGWLLYTAASAGDLRFVKELLNREPLLVYGAGEYGVTDIFYAAARSKSSETLRLLFRCSLSPKGAGNGGEFSSTFHKEMMNRAVHAAARGGNLDILNEFLGDCSHVLDYRDDLGSTVLHSASGRGQVKVVKNLLESYNISNSRDKQWNTALHIAAYRGHLAVVEVLVSSSPSSILLTNDSGDTFLHMAVAGFSVPSFRRLDKQMELMKQLVSGKIVKIEEIINVRNNDGKTALHLAVMMENIQTDLVELLMTESSIDLNICDDDGNTPLDLLKQHLRPSSSGILIKRLTSAGGISNVQNHMEKSGIVSHINKPQCVIGSPGTAFRISDAEIFTENVSDAHNVSASTDYSSCLDEMSPCHSVAGSNSSHNKKRGLKALVQRAWRKEAIRRGIGNKLEDKDSDESYAEHLSLSLEEKPIPLRQRFSATPSISDNQETTTSSNSPSLQSPTSKKKFARSPFGSPWSPFTGPFWASPEPFYNGEKSKMKRKYNSFNVRLVNKYLCFGAQGLAT